MAYVSFVLRCGLLLTLLWYLIRKYESLGKKQSDIGIKMIYSHTPSKCCENCKSITLQFSGEETSATLLVQFYVYNTTKENYLSYPSLR